ncbi:MAG: hypothetical protein ABFD83_10940 [Armatimonadota bacterium]
MISDNLCTPYKTGRLVVEPSLVPGRFDSHFVDAPYVFKWGDKYYMTFIGWDSIGYRTGLATSYDLLNWTNEGMIIDRGPAGSPTEYNVALTWILRDNDLFGDGSLRQVEGRFLGTYHAYPNPGMEEGSASIGLCWSDDLRNWQLDDPFLHCDDPDAGDWERGGLYKSCILEHDGVYYMFYNAKQRIQHPWNEQTGLVTSPDLKRWTRAANHPVLANGGPGSPDEIFASDPCVLRMEDKWVMFYFGLASDGHARECAALSDDLIHWEKIDKPMIDIGSPGEIDSTHAHKPSVISRNGVLIDVGLPGEVDSTHAAKPSMVSCDGVLYHFYCATAPAEEGSMGEIDYPERRGIALATSVVVSPIPSD